MIPALHSGGPIGSPSDGVARLHRGEVVVPDLSPIRSRAVPADLPAHPQVVGRVEIAVRLGVDPMTVDKWRTREIFPDPRWNVGGRPAWRWADVERWARATGRL